MEKETQIYKHIIDTEVFPYLFENQNSSQNILNQTSNLVKCLSILNFDDEIGQVTEYIYPLDSLDKINIKNISGLGFPETNSMTDDGETKFIFKIRQSNNSPLRCTSISDQKFYYCYTIFIQKKNSKYKRGYMQKSIIIISEFYYKKFYMSLLEEFKEIFLNEVLIKETSFSIEKLEKLYNLFNNNLAEKVSSDNTDIELVINDNSDEFKDNSTVGSVNEHIKNLKMYMEISIYPQNNNFFEHLSLHYVTKIWNLWELIITETPLIIQSDNSSHCSEIVFLLSSLIFPLNYCGDIRPYFTIYDNDFKDYKDYPQLKTSNSPIFGVINPLCVKSFPDWPVLHFDDMFFTENSMTNPFKSYSKNYFQDETLSVPNYKRKFVITPNKILIKTFIEYVEDQNNKTFDRINIYLRMYLIELNNDFMRTFEEYFFQYEFKQIQRLAVIKPNFSIFEIFNEEKFFKYLNANPNKFYFNKKYVNDKNKTIDLYQNFVKTKCFNFYLKNLIKRIKRLEE